MFKNVYVCFLDKIRRFGVQIVQELYRYGVRVLYSLPSVEILCAVGSFLARERQNPVLLSNEADGKLIEVIIICVSPQRDKKPPPCQDVTSVIKARCIFLRHARMSLECCPKLGSPNAILTSI